MASSVGQAATRRPEAAGRAEPGRSGGDARPSTRRDPWKSDERSRPTARVRAGLDVAWRRREEQARRSSLLHDGSGAAQLALDLLAGPAGRLDGSWLEFAVCARLLDEGRDPVLSEDLHQLAARVRFRQIAADVVSYGPTRAFDSNVPNNAHRGPHQSLAPVEVVRHDVEELKDGLHVRLEDIGWNTCQRTCISKSRKSSRLLLLLVFIAPIMPPQASMMPSRSETT